MRDLFKVYNEDAEGTLADFNRQRYDVADQTSAERWYGINYSRLGRIRQNRSYLEQHFQDRLEPEDYKELMATLRFTETQAAESFEAAFGNQMVKTTDKLVDKMQDGLEITDRFSKQADTLETYKDSVNETESALRLYYNKHLAEGISALGKDSPISMFMSEQYDDVKFKDPNVRKTVAALRANVSRAQGLNDAKLAQILKSNTDYFDKTYSDTDRTLHQKSLTESELVDQRVSDALVAIDNRKDELRSALRHGLITDEEFTERLAGWDDLAEYANSGYRESLYQQGDKRAAKQLSALQKRATDLNGKYDQEDLAIETAYKQAEELHDRFMDLSKSGASPDRIREAGETATEAIQAAMDIEQQILKNRDIRQTAEDRSMLNQIDPRQYDNIDLQARKLRNDLDQRQRQIKEKVKNGTALTDEETTLQGLDVDQTVRDYEARERRLLRQQRSLQLAAAERQFDLQGKRLDLEQMQRAGYGSSFLGQLYLTRGQHQAQILSRQNDLITQRDQSQ